MDLFKIVGKIAIDGIDEVIKHLKDVSGEGEKTSSKLGKVFSGIGKGAAAIGKATLVGVGAAATGITALGTAAVKSYADYEQLVGGAKLMFGDGYDFIAEKAKTAFRDVQMSQNEYLEQVNGFAVGLKTALGGNAQEAAELSHKIVQAEADVVAATGESKENIQNAFNGIMKSNFQMLDNLKLGITPTKEGFQDVIDKVNEWNKANGEATNYQIDNLADCQSALVDYIEMQGLSGYAAREASQTIQGSWGMLKGAWGNLMTGLADPSADLGQLIGNVFEGVNALAGNLVPRISQILSGIATSMSQLVPLLTAELPNLLQQVLPPLIEGATSLVNGLVAALPQILNALMAALPQLIQGVITLVNGLVTAIPQIINILIQALPQIVQMLCAALPQMIPALITGIVSMITTLCANAAQIIQPIIDNLPMIITSIVDALLTNLPALIVGVTQLIVALAAALPQIIGALWTAIGQIFVMLGQKVLGFFAPVKTAISNAWQAMGNVPGLAQMKTMIENVWGAIKSHISTVISAIKNVVSTVWNSIKNVISTVLASIKNVISTAWNAIKTIISSVMKLISSVLKGDWNGVKSAISSILNAIKSVIQSVWNAIKSIISSVLNGIKSVVSSIWNGIKSVISSAVNSVKTIISSVWNGIKNTISSVLSGIKNTVKNGFNDVKNNAVNILKSIPGKIKNVGLDIVKGIGNGITNGLGWIKDKITSFVGNVTSFIKKLFGIKSPSTVMRDEVGRYLAEGVAVGISENADKAESESEKLAKNILDAAQNKLDTYKTYNKMTLAEEAGFWDSVRMQIKEGTDARLEADKKYLDAKKNLDDQILSAETELQKSLADIQQREADRKADILGASSLFGEETTADGFILRMQGQAIALENYQRNLEMLESKIGGTGLFEAIKAEGFDATEQLLQINRMSESDLKAYVDAYDKRSEVAAKFAKDELADQNIKDTEEAYAKFAKSCSELGVEVTSSVSTMENGFVKSFEKIASAVAKVGEALKSNIADMFTGQNADLTSMMAIADSTSMMNSATSATEAAQKKKETVESRLQRIIDLMAAFFPQLIEAFDVDLRLDSGALVGELAPAMDDALGRLSARKDRGR